MKLKLAYLVSGMVLALSANASQSPPSTNPNNPNNTNDEVSNIATYLQNLGQYFGYDLTQYCTTGGPCSTTGSTGGSSGSSSGPGGGTSGSQAFSNLLVDQNTAYSAQLNLYNTFLGAIIGGTTPTQNPNPIIPSTIANNSNLSGFSILNTLAGQTYTNPPFSSASSQAVSVSPLIDQQPYQSDPVSQALLNILTTPNYTFCLESGTDTINPKCSYLYREAVFQNVVGQLQGATKVFTPEVNTPLIPQLNINTLISPLLYSTTSGAAGGTSSGASGSGSLDTTGANAGLTANTQAQQAQNYIRYATGAVIPLSLPNWSTHNNLLSQALNFSKQTPVAQQQQARAQLTGYLARLRSYVAQTSVGISNLYYIMSKRLPQSAPGQGSQYGGGNQTSQALNEYIMASWRLYNPQAQGTNTNPGQKQWLTQINQASNASVQKEIAILLAEMNYQLYLMRQQQERILLTNSMMLLESSMQIQPDGSTLSTTGNTSAATTNS
ncbi:IcmX (IcmY) [Legionella beliardensis]|uniref:IcmX (IcmY) n=1 Tax=Legionella beliardensis TaxID=91822 RepID=A0A378I3U4_9GAMM|nr:type IVB secretion system protein IcmX [Legionella beliardensis]STX29848.1 IcmX (IcmY) [Legionella beliardensis]